MVQSMVEFLNGDTDYAEKKVVFKGQADYRKSSALFQFLLSVTSTTRSILSDKP
jgi:hypothetical protein